MSIEIFAINRYFSISVTHFFLSMIVLVYFILFYILFLIERQPKIVIKINRINRNKMKIAQIKI